MKNKDTWSTYSFAFTETLERTIALQDPQNFVTRHETDLGNAMRVTEGDTNLGGGKTLAGELADVLNDLLGGCLEPGWRGAAVRESGGRWTTIQASATLFHR
jgi:hypothetical protein